MTNRILAALAALVLAGTAMAATDPPAAGQPYQSFRSSDRYKHVAILTPSRWDALSQINVNSMKQNMLNNLGTSLDAMEEQGLEVHNYTTNFFESDKDHREMWTDIGSKYGLVIVLWPMAPNSAGFTRYIRADSTNAQLLVIGGADAGAGSNWMDTTLAGFCDGKSGGYEAGSALNGAGLVTFSRRDTLWFQRVASGRRVTNLPSGVSSVVRMLRPFTKWGSTWIQDADSVNTNMPVNDSTAAANEYLGPLWKVRYTNYSGQGVSTWINSLATSSARAAGDGGLSAREVVWLKVNSGVIPSRAYPHLLWSVVCRYTKAKPIRWAYDADDMADLFANNLVNGRGTNAALDSTFTLMANYGIKVATAINPDHGASYIRGENPRYEAAWSGAPHTYLRKWAATWIHHAHDSTAGHISSNLVGRFGGYSSGNGASLIEGADTHEYYTHRYASRWNPGANEGNGVGAAGNFGIIQRLQYSDSLRRRVCPECPLPPYLNFPSNQMVVKNWKPRPTTNNPLWKTRFVSATELCPIDSLLYAYAYGLRPGSSGKVKIVLRSAIGDPRTQHIDFDRDSTAAYTMFAYPGERWTVRMGGRVIEAENVDSFLQGASSVTQYVADANARTATVLGLKNPSLRAEQFNRSIYMGAGGVMESPAGSANGETFNNDVQGLQAVGTPSRDFTFRQSRRIVYQHPLGTLNGRGSYDIDCFLRSIGTQIRALDEIAGRRCTQSVWPWEVMVKQ